MLFVDVSNDLVDFVTAGQIRGHSQHCGRHPARSTRLKRHSLRHVEPVRFASTVVHIGLACPAGCLFCYALLLSRSQRTITCYRYDCIIYSSISLQGCRDLLQRHLTAAIRASLSTQTAWIRTIGASAGLIPSPFFSSLANEIDTVGAVGAPYGVPSNALQCIIVRVIARAHSTGQAIRWFAADRPSANFRLIQKNSATLAASYSISSMSTRQNLQGGAT